MLSFAWVKDLWARITGGRQGLMTQLDRGVEAHGWTAIYVGDYHTAPTWAYTLGFHETLGMPEVIIFDIPEEPANDLLWEVFNQLKDGRLTLEDGRIWPEGEERPSVWRKVDPSQLTAEPGWFTIAIIRSMARSDMALDFSAFQLVLSDNDGRLPWDEDYDERLRANQPALYLPVEDHDAVTLPPA